MELNQNHGAFEDVNASAEVKEPVEDGNTVEAKAKEQDASKSVSLSKHPVFSWIYPVLFALALAVLIKAFVIDFKTVEGTSMVPTFRSGDRVVVLRSNLVSNYKQGDVVVFDAPLAGEEYYVKRIIGVPGDEIKIFRGYVFVNGAMLPEPYVQGEQATLTENTSLWSLRDGEYFVMGDNRIPGGSLDSRDFGPILETHIHGKVLERKNDGF